MGGCAGAGKRRVAGVQQWPAARKRPATVTMCVTAPVEQSSKAQASKVVGAASRAGPPRTCEDEGRVEVALIRCGGVGRPHQGAVETRRVGEYRRGEHSDGQRSSGCGRVDDAAHTRASRGRTRVGRRRPPHPLHVSRPLYAPQPLVVKISARGNPEHPTPSQ